MGKRLCTRASDFRNEKDVIPYNVSDNKIRKEKPSMNGSVVLIDKGDDFSNPSELNKHINTGLHMVAGHGAFSGIIFLP